MKKTILTYLILFLACVGLQAQTDVPAPSSESESKSFNFPEKDVEMKRCILSFNYNHQRMDNIDGNSYGIGFEYFVTGNLSLNYNLSLGSRRGKAIGYASAGFVGGLYTFGYFLSEAANDDSDDDASTEGTVWGLFGGLLVMAIPEGISYYIPTSKDTWLVPFINPLGYAATDKGGSFASGFGVKVQQNLGETFFAAPSFGIKYLYNFGTIEYNAGIGLGIRF